VLDCVLDSVDSAAGRMGSLSGHGNQPQDSQRCAQVLNQLNNYQVLKNVLQRGSI
jgi:hypothetical protein